MVKLIDVAEIIAGQSPPSESYNSNREGMPFFQGKADFGEINPTVRYWCTSPNKISIPNDILFSLRAPVGPTNLNNIEACIGRGLAAIRCKEKIDTKYLLHYLRCNEEKIASLGTGSTFKAITIGTLKDIQIPLPPLPEQKRIAALLDAADSLRQKDKALLAKYDELSKSLFLEMFGDPVRNERGWEKCTVRDLVREVKYGTSAKADTIGKFPYLRMNNISYSGQMEYNDLKYINVTEEEFEKYSVKKGDVLFNRTNSKELVGKTGIITDDSIRIIAGYLIRVRTNEKANPYYLWAHLNSSWAKSTLQNMCKSIVGMANINAQELQDIIILKAPIELQNKFANLIESIETQKRQVELSLAKSEEVFRGVMGEVFG